MKQSVTYTETTESDFRYLLTGGEWYTDPGEPLVITFSFPSAVDHYAINPEFGYAPQSAYDEPFRAGFSSLSEHHKALARQALADLSYAANIHFVTSEHPAEADIRIALTDIEASVGYAYTPYTQEAYAESAIGEPRTPTDESGDVWLSVDWVTDNLPDDYFISLITHEVGHALGLDHPHQNGDFGAFAVNNTLSDVSQDYARYSVMSYNRWPQTVAESSISYSTVALTPMPLDIDALQYLYGAPANTTDDVYTLLGKGEWNRQNVDADYAASIGAQYHEYPSGYVTIVDAGGVNALRLAFDLGVTIDLRPGSWSSTLGGYETFGVDATGAPFQDENLYIHETTVIHSVTTGAGDDTIIANLFGNTIHSGAGDDRILVSGGDHRVYGGNGNDAVDFGAVSVSEFRIEMALDDSMLLTHLPSMETTMLSGIESVVFGDRAFSTDALRDEVSALGKSLILSAVTDGASPFTVAVGEVGALEAQLYRVYLGGLGRVPDEIGFQWWFSALEAGTHSWTEVATGFTSAPEFQQLADQDQNGVVANDELIFHLYTTVLGRPPDADGLDWWRDQMASEAVTGSEVLLGMAQSEEFVWLTALTVSDFFMI